MADVTVIVLTKDEELNLPDCLKSVKGFADRVIIVDGESSDGTVELAKEFGADVYIHPFENYARQFNWAIDNLGVTTKWILRLDADERLTQPLCEELEKQCEIHKNDDINGFTMEAWLYFMGKKSDLVVTINVN